MVMKFCIFNNKYILNYILYFYSTISVMFMLTSDQFDCAAIQKNYLVC